MSQPDFRPAIHALDCKLRREKDETRREQLKNTIHHLREADRPGAAKFIGRQLEVLAGTHRPTESQWWKDAMARIAAGKGSGGKA